MKINGKEIDMQKVVKLYEMEQCRVHDEKTKKKIREWWSTGPGLIQRERNRDRIQTMIEDGFHRKKIKYLLINVDDENDKYAVEGGEELAQFLGYKKYNSSMNTSRRFNKSKSKEFYITIMED